MCSVYSTISSEEFKDRPPGVPSTKGIDDFLKMGRYCLLVLIASEFFLFVGAGNMIFMVFAGTAPKVSCHGKNFIIEDVCKNHSILAVHEECDLKIEYEFRSLNVEFGYLCEEGRWVKSSISVQMIGVLLGTLFFGVISDRYGRKISLMASYAMTSVLSIAASFSDSLFTFTAIRTALTFFAGGLISTYGVYKMEHIPKQHRLWVATLISWGPNYILLNVIAYLSQDWRTLQRVLFLISTPSLVMFFHIYESPRWLIQKGKMREARHVLQQIQAIDGEKESDEEAIETMLEATFQKTTARERKNSNYSFRYLFYNKEMSMTTVVYCSGLFMTSFINYGIVFNIESLSGSFFVNSIIMGVLRWSVNIVFAVLDYRLPILGRKTIHLIAQSSISVALAVAATFYIFKLDGVYPGVIRVATIFASALTTQVILSKNISAIEFYPTIIRNSGLAFKATCGRIGSIIAPQLFFMSSWDALPYMVTTAMATLDTALFQYVITETKGKQLSDELSPERDTGAKQR